MLRRIEVLRGGWGAAMVLAPRFVLAHVHRVVIDTRSVAISRVLGARQLGQAVLSGADPSPEVLAMGVWVDAAHAATAASLALVDEKRRRATLADMAVAALWAGAGYRDLKRPGVTATRHDRTRDALARLVLGVVPGGRRLRRLADLHRQQRT